MGVGLDEGVVEEDVWLGNLVEQVVGMVEVANGGGGEDELGGEGVGGEEAGGEEEGLGLEEMVRLRAGVECGGDVVDDGGFIGREVVQCECSEMARG